MVLFTTTPMLPLLLLVLLTAHISYALKQNFAIEPVDRTAILGDTIILPCRVVNRVGTLQWTKDGFGLGNGRDLAGFPRYMMTGNDDENDFSLQIRNVQLEDDAEFQCQVGPTEGTKGIRSRSAVVQVNVPPEPPKIIEGNHIRTTAGSTVELNCEAAAGKPAAEVSSLPLAQSYTKNSSHPSTHSLAPPNACVTVLYCTACLLQVATKHYAVR